MPNHRSTTKSRSSQPILEKKKSTLYSLPANLQLITRATLQSKGATMFRVLKHKIWQKGQCCHGISIFFSFCPDLQDSPCSSQSFHKERIHRKHLNMEKKKKQNSLRKLLPYC